MKIHKVEIPIKDGPFYVEVPKRARFLSRVTWQEKIIGKYGYLSLWYMFDDQIEEPAETATLLVVGTGHPFQGLNSYIGTEIVGDLAWHVLERLPRL